MPRVVCLLPLHRTGWGETRAHTLGIHWPSSASQEGRGFSFAWGKLGSRVFGRTFELQKVWPHHKRTAFVLGKEHILPVSFY